MRPRNKSIVGVGSAGVIRGKGLRLLNGVSSVIIQSIHITELNPQYIRGGDAIIPGWHRQDLN
jgi:pectate lyase